MSKKESVLETLPLTNPPITESTSIRAIKNPPRYRQRCRPELKSSTMHVLMHSRPVTAAGHIYGLPSPSSLDSSIWKKMTYSTAACRDVSEYGRVMPSWVVDVMHARAGGILYRVPDLSRPDRRNRKYYSATKKRRLSKQAVTKHSKCFPNV